MTAVSSMARFHNEVLRRNYNRTERHGNWRQVYIDCMGMCMWPGEDGVVCGEVDNLEFHDMYGENHHSGTEGKFQQRLLVCVDCHYDKVHAGCITKNDWRGALSHLSVDVSYEIIRAGGFDRWCAKYGLDGSRLGIAFPSEKQGALLGVGNG